MYQFLIKDIAKDTDEQMHRVRRVWNKGLQAPRTSLGTLLSSSFWKNPSSSPVLFAFYGDLTA
jgi:hypothetical protein